MATVQYSIVFYLMVAEIVSFLLLLLPMPDKWKKGLFKAIGKSKLISSTMNYVKFIYGFVLLLFIDSIVRTRKLQKERLENPILDEKLASQRLVTMFYAQRNIYLTGFTLLLGLIMLATHRLIIELIDVRSKVVSARKLSGIHAASEDTNAADKDAELAILKAKLAKANKELENFKNINLDFAQIKAKAKNSREEYLELLESHKKLLEKVEKGGSKSKLS